MKRPIGRPLLSPVPSNPLKNLIHAHGLTLTDVAKAAGVAPSTLSQWLNNRWKPTPATEARIVAVLNTIMFKAPKPPVVRRPHR